MVDFRDVHTVMSLTFSTTFSVTHFVNKQFKKRKKKNVCSFDFSIQLFAQVLGDATYYYVSSILTMNKNNLKYYLIPAGYILSLLTMELYSNILSVGFFLLVLIISVIALVALIINRGQRTFKFRFALAVVSVIPFIDLSPTVTC